MLNLKNYQSDLADFVELGMMAIKQGDEESAKKLFNATGLINPKTTTKQMGYGLIALHKLDIPQAQKCFTEVMQQEPKNGRAFAFMAFTHMLALMEEQNGNKKLEYLKQAATLAEKAIALSDEPSTKQLAQSVLDWESQLQNLEIL